MKRSVIVLIHIGYWLLYFFMLFFIMVFTIIGVQGGKANLEKINVLDLVSHISALAVLPGAIGFYFFYTYLYSNFLKKKKILKLFISGILFSIVTGAFGLIVMDILFRNFSILEIDLIGVLVLIAVMSLITVLNGGMGLILRGFITSYEDIKVKEELKRKNLEVELSLIKSQLNPHFLFNTINNIDVLIQRDPAKASIYLNELSDLMRYMLYETKNEKIFFEKEIHYIKKYIDLQKIRTSNHEYVSLSVIGEFSEITTEPMLLIPFIENAFKHAESKKEGNVIEIQISIQNRKINFLCRNSYIQSPKLNDGIGGLGNELINKRLNLLFPEKHELLVNDSNGIYEVKLSIDVSEN